MHFFVISLKKTKIFILIYINSDI